MVQSLCDFLLVVGFALLGELGGCEVAVGGVGPVHVVVDSEVLDQDLGLEQRVELPAVEQLVSELAVERLDPGVLPWRAGIDEDRVDAVEPAPVRNRSGDELAAVVEADKRRRPVDRGQTVQHVDDVIGIDGSCHLDGETLPGVLVDDVQHLDGSPIVGNIELEVERPQDVWSNG